MGKDSSAEDDDLGLGSVAAAWTIGGRDFLPYRITLLAKLLDRCTMRLLSASSGLTVAEWRVLAQLVRSSPLSVRQLAEQAWVDRAEVSRAAASLEKRGCIERRANPRDKRSPLLYCTPEGLALAEQIIPSRVEFHASLTGLLDPAQAEALDTAMLTLARHCVDQLEPDAPEARRPRSRRRR